MNDMTLGYVYFVHFSGHHQLYRLFADKMEKTEYFRCCLSHLSTAQIRQVVWKEPEQDAAAEFQTFTNCWQCIDWTMTAH